MMRTVRNATYTALLYVWAALFTLLSSLVANAQGLVTLPITGNPTDINNVTIIGDKMFFTAVTPQTGNELWVSGGTSATTHIVRDIRRGPADAGITELIPFGTGVAFFASDGIVEDQLWTSDGITATAHAGSWTLPTFARYCSNGRLLFFPSNSDPLSASDTIIEFDGSAFRRLGEGDIAQIGKNVGFRKGLTGVQDTTFIYPVGNTTPYVAIDDTYVWVTRDYLYSIPNSNKHLVRATIPQPFGPPTPATVLLDFSTGTSLRIRGIEYGYEVVPYRGQYMLSAARNSETELYTWDGVSDTAILVKTINPLVNQGSDPFGFTQLGDSLYFSATDGAVGRELWVTDGTASHTHQVTYIDLVNDSQVSGLMAQGSRLLFSADSGGRTRRLYMYSPTNHRWAHLKSPSTPSVGNAVTASVPSRGPNGKVYWLDGSANAWMGLDTNSVVTFSVSDPSHPANDYSNSAAVLFPFNGNYWVYHFYNPQVETIAGFCYLGVTTQTKTRGIHTPLSLAPNPTTSETSLSEPTDASIEVYDPNGQRVLALPARHGQASIDVTGLRPGIYMLVTGATSLRFVKM